MARDRVADPRLHARTALEEDRTENRIGEAQVWATLYLGDALHRLAKAAEMNLDPDEVAARRSNQDSDEAMAEAA